MEYANVTDNVADGQEFGSIEKTLEKKKERERDRQRERERDKKKKRRAGDRERERETETKRERERELACVPATCRFVGGSSKLMVSLCGQPIHFSCPCPT